MANEATRAHGKGNDTGTRDVAMPSDYGPLYNSPVLKFIATRECMLSSLIASPDLLKVYNTVDAIMAELYRLMYWDMVSTKYVDDLIEGDDYHLFSTNMGKAALRISGG